MNQIDLRNVDLNLLIVLDVLLRERSVSAAAKKLSRTQSAISHALGRLRQALHDPLLVWAGGEMKPTPYAEVLAFELERILNGIARMLSQPTAFEPATSTRKFVIAAPDFAMSVFGTVHAAAAAQAPFASIEWSLPKPFGLKLLSEEKCDFVIAPGTDDLPDGLAWKELGAIDWAVFTRHDNPVIHPWGLTQWKRASHLMVRVGDDTAGPVSHILRDKGLERHVAVYAPNFAVVAPLLSKSDLLATMPRIVMAETAALYNLSALELPFPIPKINHWLYWNLRTSRDPGLEWLRDILLTAFEKAMETAMNLKVKKLVSDSR